MHLNIVFDILDCCLRLWYNIQAKSVCLGESFDVFNNLTPIKCKVMEMNLFILWVFALGSIFEELVWSFKFGCSLTDFDAGSTGDSIPFTL
jgi:hypothetical protein